ncbi:hypothetical protein Ddc_17642 [Ditylenchus destructor]|nr:hypothetical protein Ddc_17642 [Ditylenchus destructor]
MNLECQVCTGNKIGTSFYSLDDLQGHLFTKHHDGPTDVFQFVCHKCDHKFGTEYRLLRHEEKCGRESRSEEALENIRHQIRIYEMIEESLKYNMTKNSGQWECFNKMDLQCHECDANIFATSFCSLDELIAHMFSNHQTGPLDVFQFRCHKCDFKFGTEYRLLRHKETCGRESRSEEDTAKIRYKFQMYELLEESLTYNMSKPQTAGMPTSYPSRTETTAANPTQISNASHKRVLTFGSSVKPEVQNKSCPNDSATSTQSNVKTENEDVDTSEPEFLGIVETRKRKAPSKPSEHTPKRNEGNVNSAGESSNLRLIEDAKKKRVTEETVSRTEVPESSGCNQRIPMTRYYENEIGPHHVAYKRLHGSGSSYYKVFECSGCNQTRKTRDRDVCLNDDGSKGEHGYCFICLRRLVEEAINDNSMGHKRGGGLTCSRCDNLLVIQERFLRKMTKEDLEKYRELVTIGARPEGHVDLPNLETGTSNAQPMKPRVNPDETMPHSSSDNVYVQNYPIKLPADMMDVPVHIPRFNSANLEKRMATLTSNAASFTNRIHVSGPCLYPMEENAREHQREDLRTYFGQFGKIFTICIKPIFDDMTTDAIVTFAHCKSAAKCMEQSNHKILGQDFRVERGQPSKGAKRKIIAYLEQNLPHLPEENDGPNYQSSLPEGMTNRIFVCGPCLHPEQVDPRASQNGDLRAYFGQFGAIVNIANQKTTVATKMKSKVAFENCDSARQCLQQNTHKICGLDFFVWAATPTRGMKRRLEAILNQNVPGPSSGNVSTSQNVHDNPAAESNPGSQWLECVKTEAAIEKKKRKCRRP